MYSENIYMIIVDGYIQPEYGWFNNFDAAKAVAAKVAADYNCVENSWKSEELYVNNDDRVVGIECIEHHTSAQWR